MAELDLEETLIAPAPRPHRKIRATRRGLWTPRRVIALALAIGALVIGIYLVYLVTVAVLRSDLDRANTGLSERVQAQSVELSRLQAKSADLEAKLAAAITDLGIVRSKLQLQRAASRSYQARTHLAAGDRDQALKDLNDASLALGAAGAIASAESKTQISSALTLVEEAEQAIRAQSGESDRMLERLGDQLSTLTAD